MSPEASGRKAFTVLEMLVVLALFGVLSTVALLAVREASKVWRHSTSRSDVARSLARAWTVLRTDLTNTRLAPETFAQGPVPASLGTGNDGDACCFLTPIDPAGWNLVSKPDGSPRMMRNVCYYLIVPANHDALVGQNCSGGADGQGYENQCPHKLLVRRVIDHGDPTSATDPEDEEILKPDWQNLLERPTSLSGSTIDRRIVATNLLGFRIRPVGKTLSLELSALSTEEARRTVDVGHVPLSDSTFRVAQTTSVTPRN